MPRIKNPLKEAAERDKQATLPLESAGKAAKKAEKAEKQPSQQAGKAEEAERRQEEMWDDEDDDGLVDLGDPDDEDWEEEDLGEPPASELYEYLYYTEEQTLQPTDELPLRNMPRAAVRERRRYYKQVKKMVKIFEKTNTSKMYVFRDYRAPWFKAGGNSALFYAFDMAGKGGKRKVNINTDWDGNSTFRDGTVSFHGVETLLETMTKAGVEKPKVIYNGWVLVFDLGKTYDKAELRAMQRTAETRRRAVNELVMTQNLNPAVYHDILQLNKRVMPNLFKLGANQRAVFAPPAIERLIELHSTYLEMTRGTIGALEAAERMDAIVTWFISMMKILMEARFWEMTVCAPIAEVLADLRNTIKQDIVKPEMAKRGEKGEDEQCTERCPSNSMA